MITKKQQSAQSLAHKLIPIQPCEVCQGIIDVHRHHDDYDQPLEVRFLCRTHHMRWHKVNQPLNRCDKFAVFVLNIWLILYKDKQEQRDWVDLVSSPLPAPKTIYRRRRHYSHEKLLALFPPAISKQDMEYLASR